VGSCIGVQEEAIGSVGAGDAGWLILYAARSAFDHQRKSILVIFAKIEFAYAIKSR